jgi:hypothetical protein
MDRSPEHLDPAGIGHTSELSPVLPVVVTEEVARPFSPWRRVPQLLCTPGISRMARHTDMDNFTGAKLDDKERKHLPKAHIDDREEVTRPALLRVIVQKGLPGLPSPRSRSS